MQQGLLSERQFKISLVQDIAAAIESADKNGSDKAVS